MSLVFDMAKKIGSERSVKTKRAQDCLVALSLEALERGSAVASPAPVMHGTGEGDGIGRKESCTGRKQNRTGRKQKRSKDIRIRTGRKQGRRGRDQTGRKRDRRGRDQRGRDQTGRKRDEAGRKRLNRREKKRRTLNVRHQWACLLLQGVKTVEVRTWPLGRRQGEEHWIEETWGGKKPRGFKNFLVGVITFKDDFQYTSYSHFRSDELRHQIPAGSPFDWDVAQTPVLYGWTVDDVCRLVKPLPAAAIKGGIGAKPVTRRGTFKS